MPSLFGGLVSHVHLADLHIELYTNALTRDCFILPRYVPINQEFASLNPEIFKCMITCLYTESQIAILPNPIRSAIMSSIETFAASGKQMGVTPSWQEPIPNCSKSVDMRIEFFYGKSPTVKSHPKFICVQGQPMRAEALIGIILNNLLRWPFTQISPEGQTAYIMLMDIAATNWKRKWPNFLGGTWGKFTAQDVCAAGQAIGWESLGVWNKWLSVVNPTEQEGNGGEPNG